MGRIVCGWHLRANRYMLHDSFELRVVLTLATTKYAANSPLPVSLFHGTTSSNKYKTTLDQPPRGKTLIHTLLFFSYLHPRSQRSRAL